MPMTHVTAMARARAMIQTIRYSLVPGLVERNREMAERYALSLLECGLIKRNEYEDLMVEIEMEFSRWRVTLGLQRHL